MITNQQDDENASTDHSLTNVDFDNVCGGTDFEDTSHLQAKVDAEIMHQKQLEDESLKGWWSRAKRGKGRFFVKDNLLYHMERILGQSFSQLCLPKGRRNQVLELARDTFDGHLGEKHL